MTFDSPNEAAAALLAAVQAGDYPRFALIAGPRMASFWDTGDPERDVIERAHLLDAARRSGIRLAAVTADRNQLYVGDIRQPFPAPLVKSASGWRFDEDTGAREVAARRIRRNETALVELCRHFREAEFAYSRLPYGDGAFAAKFRSTPGRHDGLFWTGPGEEDESPLGPSFAVAAFAEQQKGESPRPLFGYYFKILVEQGPGAPGGVVDYRSNGRLRKGFALIAWPAKYGLDGVRSFLINHLGDLYEQDLGPETVRVAGGTSAFNPDAGWSRVLIHD